MMRMTLKS